MRPWSFLSGYIWGRDCIHRINIQILFVRLWRWSSPQCRRDLGLYSFGSEMASTWSTCISYLYGCQDDFPLNADATLASLIWIHLGLRWHPPDLLRQTHLKQAAIWEGNVKAVKEDRWNMKEEKKTRKTRDGEGPDSWLFGSSTMRCWYSNLQPLSTWDPSQALRNNGQTDWQKDLKISSINIFVYRSSLETFLPLTAYDLGVVTFFAIATFMLMHWYADTLALWSLSLIRGLYIRQKEVTVAYNKHSSNQDYSTGKLKWRARRETMELE